MNRRSELAGRRAALVARSELQRRQAAHAAYGMTRALWPVDVVEVLARRAAGHPVMLVGVIFAVVLVLRPGRVLKMVAWGASAALAVRRMASDRDAG